MDVEDRFSPDYRNELFYRSLIPINPKLILVLIPGAGEHSGQFLDLGKYCLQNNIAFYVMDLRGFGKSTGKRGHVHSFYEYLNDLDSFLCFVKNKHPLNQFRELFYQLRL